MAWGACQSNTALHSLITSIRAFCYLPLEPLRDNTSIIHFHIISNGKAFHSGQYIDLITFKYFPVFDIFQSGDVQSTGEYIVHLHYYGSVVGWLPLVIVFGAHFLSKGPTGP